MKRLLSIFIAVIMVAAMVLPTTAVFADEEVAFDPFAGDYVAGELTDNVFQQPNNVGLVDVVPRVDSKGNAVYPHSRYLTINSDFKADLSGWSRGLAGPQLIGASPAQGFASGFQIEGQDTMVFRFSVKNYGTTDSFVWNAALCNSSWNFSGVYPIECGADGFTVSDKENWTNIEGTCKMPGNVGTMYTPTFMIGFQEAAAGSSAEINYGTLAATPYMAFEKAHDIVLVNKGEDVIVAGNTNEFEAKIVNQVGSTGYLTQPAFTFTAFDAEGNAVEGISVSETGTLSVATGVADGTYYIRATTAIAEDTTWQKTLAFNVIGAIENTDDYVAKNLNAIGNPAEATNYNQFNVTNQVIAPQTTPGVYIWNVKTATPAGAGHTGYLAGSIFRTSGGNYIDSDFKILTGEKLVLKMAVKNVGTTDSVKVNASLSNNVTWSTATFSEEYGKEGALVTSKDDWTILQFTLTMPGKTGVEYNPRLAFGFPEGTPVGSGIAINLDTPGVPKTFVGKYEPSDISVTGASSTVEVGKSLDLAAQVFNSEFEGEFKQSFDWVAVNTARTRYIDGITFTPSNDGANVKVNVADTVAPGEYLIVAQNADYGMNRQYPITVTAPTYDVTELTLNTTATGATLEALTVNTNKTVKVVLAAFAGNKVVTSNKTEITPVDGVATLADPLAISGLSAGNKVRVFVWDTLLAPFSMKSAWKTPITIE